MTLAYWIVASLLSVFYLYSGGMKLIQSKERLEPMMGWVDTVPMPVVRFLGVVEVLGAVGLVLPPLTDVAPWLAIAAAAGLLVLQVLAAGVHLRRGEVKQSAMNWTLIVLAAVTAWLATAF